MINSKLFMLQYKIIEATLDELEKPTEYARQFITKMVIRSKGDIEKIEYRVSEFLLECSDDTGKSPETMVKEAQELAKTIIANNK